MRLAAHHGAAIPARLPTDWAIFPNGRNGAAHRVARIIGLSRRLQAFATTCTPSANASLGSESPSGLPCAGASVYYSAFAYPVRIRFAGVLDPNNNKKMLIGQTLRTTVDLGGLQTTGNNTFTWDISGGAPFTNYVPSTPSVYTGWSSTVITTVSTSTSVNSCFAQAPKATVTCSVATTLPSLVISLKDSVALVAPTLSHTAEPIGTMRLLTNNSPDIVNPTDFRLWGANYPGFKTWGVYYNYCVETPAEFLPGDTGLFCAAQLVTDSSSYTDAGGVVGPPITGEGLDRSYPYPGTQTNWTGATRHVNPDATLNWRWFSDRPGFEGRDPNPPHAVIPLLQLDPTLVSLSCDQSFKLYIMYDGPDNGIGHLNVPLRLVRWHAIGTATVGNPWTYSDGGSTIDSTTDITTHPMWTQVHP